METNEVRQSFLVEVDRLMNMTRNIDSNREITEKLGLEVDHRRYFTLCDEMLDLIERAYRMGLLHGEMSTSQTQGGQQ